MHKFVMPDLIRHPRVLKSLDSGSTHCRNDDNKEDYYDILFQNKSSFPALCFLRVSVVYLHAGDLFPWQIRLL